MAETKQCDECGAVIAKRPRLGKGRWALVRYCSQACTGKARARRLAETRPRFVEKFENSFTRYGDGCWEWQGTIDGYGYGVMDYAGERYRAHVIALELDGRPVPEGGVARHNCDNPRCVRPDHLQPGTQADNVADAMARDRHTRGERNGHAKLTDEVVRQMRALSGVNYTTIAKMFGVSRATATKALKGDSWRHVR